MVVVFRGRGLFLDTVLEQRQRARVISFLVKHPTQRIAYGVGFRHQLLGFLGQTQSQVQIAALLHIEKSEVVCCDRTARINGQRLFVMLSRGIQISYRLIKRGNHCE